MKKNARQNLLLLLAVALLACGLFFVKNYSSQDKELRLPISPDELQTITIQHTEKIELEKRNDKWFMNSPQQGLIKPERIKKMLTYLMLPLESGFSAEPEKLELYGLDVPRMQVTLNNEVLSFGSLSTMQQLHYIQFKDKVYLARPFLQISFDKSSNDLLAPEN